MFLWNEEAYFRWLVFFWPQKEKYLPKSGDIKKLKKDKGNILNKNKKVF